MKTPKTFVHEMFIAYCEKEGVQNKVPLFFLPMLNVQTKMRNFNIRANHARLFEVQQARGKYCWATHLKLAPLAVKGFSANTTNNFNPQWLQSQHIPPFGGVENDEMLFQNKIIKACAFQ